VFADMSFPFIVAAGAIPAGDTHDERTTASGASAAGPVRCQPM
jgi:hypothetical protein